MKSVKYHHYTLAITMLLGALIGWISLTGLLVKDFYVQETLNWQVQSLGQDTIDLFLVVPVLLVTGILASKNYRIGAFLWTGTLLYIVYTFVIYCFDIHFNRLFPVYCIISGLSFYAFAWSIYRQTILFPLKHITNNPLRKVTSIYFIVIAILFYALWFSDILPAVIAGTVPANLSQSGLPTNPVHVIDLSFFLPAVFMTGILLLRKKAAAFVLANIFLCFFILMNVTIGWLAIKMAQEDPGSNVIVIIAMSLLVTMSFILLALNLKAISSEGELLLNTSEKRFSYPNHR